MVKSRTSAGGERGEGGGAEHQQAVPHLVSNVLVVLAVGDDVVSLLSHVVLLSYCVSVPAGNCRTSDV